MVERMGKSDGLGWTTKRSRARIDRWWWILKWRVERGGVECLLWVAVSQRFDSKCWGIARWEGWGFHSGVSILGQIRLKNNNFGSTSWAGVKIHPIQWHLDEAIAKSISNIFGYYKQEIYFTGTFWSIGGLILVRIPVFGEGVLIWTQTYSTR